MKKILILSILILTSLAVFASDLIIESKTQTFSDKEKKIKLDGGVKVKNTENDDKRDAKQVTILGITEGSLLLHLDSLLTVDLRGNGSKGGGIADATPPPPLSYFGNTGFIRDD